METLWQDLRFAARMLRRTPLVAALAVLCMGLGIGAVTTMYSTATAFTLRPIPQVRDASRVLHVWEAPVANPRAGDGIAPGVMADLRGLRELGGLAVLRMEAMNVAGFDVPERVTAARISADFLRTIGRAPLLGRDFTAADAAFGAPRVALLSWGLWRRRFGGDSTVLGRAVRVNGEGYEVVGILPDEAAFPVGAQLFVPLQLSPAEAGGRRDRSLFVLARVAPGVAVSRAQAATAALGDRLVATYPESEGRVLRAEPAEGYFGSGPRPFMNVLLASSAFVLLIACANVANLLLARAATRRREVALRVALGASRTRIVRQLLTESVLIALAGAVLGVLVAVWGLAGLGASVPVEVRSIIPGFGMLHLDLRALGVAAAVAVASGVLFGLAPALAAVRTDVQASLKDGGRGEVAGGQMRRLRGALVVGEVALALVLLVGATLMITTFRNLALTDPGFRREGVLTLSVSLPERDYPADSSVSAFYRTLLDRVAELPGVEAAGATTVLPMSWNEYRSRVELEGRPLRRPEDAPVLGLRMVSPEYLRTLGIALTRGRGLTPDDGMGAPRVAVISEAAAQMLWPGEDPIGKRFRLRGGEWAAVVGITGNVRGNVLVADDPKPVLYLPYLQAPSRSMTLVLRTAGDPASFALPVQRTISAIDSRLAAGDITPMGRVVLSAVSPQSATSKTLAAAAFIALFLAGAGIYGVLAYSVAQRTQEIGVRSALGATPGSILRLVLKQAMLLSGGGLALGIVGALFMGRGMKAILAGTDATDPLTIGGVAAVLGLIALFASWLPARRATKIDPIVAIRAD